MFQFRNAIPVLYVFAEFSIFVNYRFNHWVDLNTIATQPRYSTAEVIIDEGDWTYSAAAYTSALPDGTQLKPLVIKSIVDRTGLLRQTSMNDAYAKTRPDVV